MARLGSMRWERLFADLEAQLEGELRRDLDAEVADRTRRELAQVDLGARLSAQVGSSGVDHAAGHGHGRDVGWLRPCLRAAGRSARARAAVQVTDLSGARRTGTIDRVGADFFDLAEHASGEVRRTVNVLGRRTLPFSAVVMIQSS